MARMQVYLPEDLYSFVKSEALPVSELLQGAIRAEMKRRRLNAATDEYLREVEAKAGAPSADDRAKASAILAKVVGGKSRKKAG